MTDPEIISIWRLHALVDGPLHGVVVPQWPAGPGGADFTRPKPISRRTRVTAPQMVGDLPTESWNYQPKYLGQSFIVPVPEGRVTFDIQVLLLHAKHYEAIELQMVLSHATPRVLEVWQDNWDFTPHLVPDSGRSPADEIAHLVERGRSYLSANRRRRQLRQAVLEGRAQLRPT